MPEPNVPLRSPKGSQFPDMSPINVDPRHHNRCITEIKSLIRAQALKLPKFSAYGNHKTASARGKFAPSGFSACGNRGPSIWNVPISSLYQNKIYRGWKMPIYIDTTKTAKNTQRSIRNNCVSCLQGICYGFMLFTDTCHDSYIINVKHADLKLKCPYYG